MDLYLEGAVPIGLGAREENNYTLDTAALEIWKQILQADPDARDGLYLKLAIATALCPAGLGQHRRGRRCRSRKILWFATSTTRRRTRTRSCFPVSIT